MCSKYFKNHISNCIRFWIPRLVIKAEKKSQKLIKEINAGENETVI